MLNNEESNQEGTTRRSPETIILHELLGAGDRFVSGNLLAERLGVSRVAVWSHMEKLRTAGFEFEGRPRLGYRIARTPTGLNEVYLRALLPPRDHDLRLFFHESVDSTNSEAERLLANGAPAPFVVLSRSQTRGRGRLGREWFSADQGNLYLSFAFQPRLSPRRMQTFTLWMGAALCDFLNRREGAPIRIKWPNDLLLNGKKVGGMLTEARIDNDQTRDLVFGLGLNVNGKAEQLPADLQGIASSLAEGLGRPLNLNRFASALLTRVLDACRDFTEGKHESELQRLWPLYDSLAGQRVTACQGRERFTGVSRGIDAEGCLLLEQPDGRRTRVSAGDVTLEKNCERRQS